MTDPKFKTTNEVSRDLEAIVRIARAVIRRVLAENPTCFGGDLRLRLSAANPFDTQDDSMRQIWQEEITWALQSQRFSLN